MSRAAAALHVQLLARGADSRAAAGASIAHRGPLYGLAGTSIILIGSYGDRSGGATGATNGGSTIPLAGGGGGAGTSCGAVGQKTSGGVTGMPGRGTDAWPTGQFGAMPYGKL